MAATYLDITDWPKNVIPGVTVRFRVTARNADGSVDTGYTGIVVFTCSDSVAVLPASHTFVGGDAGTKLFEAELVTLGAQTLVASDGSILAATGRCTVARPIGWGLEDEGILPYGDAASGIGAYLKKADVLSTREVLVEVSNLVQDNSPFLAGDAMNPATWQVQRLDTLDFLHVVGVTQAATFKYVLLCMEEFGSVAVTHRVSTSTLLDVSGAPLNTPRRQDFLGILDEDKASVEAVLAKQRLASRDIANPHGPTEEEGFFAGTLQLDGAGDYRLETGAALVKKLILRRLISRPRDFFHLPQYGIGLRVKEPIPAADLGRLKTDIEAQCRMEPEVSDVRATLTQDAARNFLVVRIKATLKKTGESIEIGLKSGGDRVSL